jgi:hypothetical protein
MAIVTRYFSTTGAGAADGTTWADRAALFSAGNWSTVITGHDFAGSDSMVARIEGGLTYTCSQALASGLFANAPRAANPLILHGCDSSGNLLTPPDPDWTSDQPAWSTSTLPIIATTTNIATFNLTWGLYRLIGLTASGRTGGEVVSQARYSDWISLVNSTANTSTAGFANSGYMRITNSVVSMTGSSYGVGINAHGESTVHNCRVLGVAGTSGARDGLRYSGTFGSADTSTGFSRCTVVGHGGSGVATSGPTGARYVVDRCVIAGNGANGVVTDTDASQTEPIVVLNSMITGNGTFGINGQSQSHVVAAMNRLRNNTSGNFDGLRNYPTDFGNETAAGTDADEYVDSAGGDYRIKNTSSMWSKGYGVSDQPPTGGGSTRGYIIGG